MTLALCIVQAFKLTNGELSVMQASVTEYQSLITAVILAGGQGQRMGGRDKGLLRWRNQPLVEYLLLALGSQVTHLAINANRHLEQYAVYGYPVISDQLSDFQGPLAGFASALEGVKTPYIVFLPCDAPRVAADYVQRLWCGCLAENTELAVAHDGERLQPVHALVGVSLLPSLLQFLKSGQRKIDVWYAEHRYAVVDFSDQAFMFDNINTPAQYAYWENQSS